MSHSIGEIFEQEETKTVMYCRRLLGFDGCCQKSLKSSSGTLLRTGIVYHCNHQRIPEGLEKDSRILGND